MKRGGLGLPWRVGYTDGGALGVWTARSRTDSPDVCTVAAVPDERDEARARLIVEAANASVDVARPEPANTLQQLEAEVARLRAQHRRYPARITGIGHYRVSTNPLEAEFDLRWRKEQEGRPMLAALLADQRVLCGQPTWDWYEQPSERDFEVAVTVVQWLGTNVGRCFLEEVLTTPAAAPHFRRLRR